MKKTIVALSLILSFLFLGISNANALSNPLSLSRDKQTKSADKGDNPLKIVIEPSKENEELNNQEQPKEEMSMEDIFGSEQVFPFEPGFS